MDISNEGQTSGSVRTQAGDGSFAANCLLARRLAERGVRFIQLYHRDWDHHGDLKGIQIMARRSGSAPAALIKDLKQRGMLDDTLVIWGGEFGRTPMARGRPRSSHQGVFNVVRGGGIKAASRTGRQMNLAITRWRTSSCS